MTLAERCVLHPVGLALVHPPGETDSAPFFQAGAVCTCRSLRRPPARRVPERRAGRRRHPAPCPLLVELRNVYPALALAAVAAVTGARHLALHVSTPNDATLSMDDRTIPVDGKSNLLLRYRGRKKTFPYVSAGDVLSGQVPRRRSGTRSCFVGTTALGTREVVATPLDTLAGVEVQATVADNLLAQDFVSRSQFSTVGSRRRSSRRRESRSPS